MIKLVLKIISTATLLLISIYVCVGCGSISKRDDTNNKTTIQPNLITTTTIATTQNVDKDNINEKIDTIKEVIKTCLNDKIWYYGTSSEFYALQYTYMDIDIYTSTIESNKIWILFKKRLNDSYYALCFKSDARGLMNYIFSYFSKNTYNELVNEIERGDFEKYNSTIIYFDEAKLPEYDLMKEYKEIILNNIYDLVKNVLKIWDFNPGEYIISVRNFRKNDWNTYVIVSDSNQNKWILDVYIEYDGTVGENKFYKADNELLKNLIRKFEELIIKSYKINID